MTDFNKLAETMAAQGIHITVRDKEQHMQESINKRFAYFEKKQRRGDTSQQELSPAEIEERRARDIQEFYRKARIKD